MCQRYPCGNDKRRSVGLSAYTEADGIRVDSGELNVGVVVFALVALKARIHG